jgi:hypothetical protein
VGTLKYKAGMLTTKAQHSVPGCKMHPSFMEEESAIFPNYKLCRYKNDFFSSRQDQDEDLENI